MKSIRRVLLWEIMRYKPKTLFILSVVSKDLLKAISGDVSYIQWFLEELYKEVNVRESSFAICKEILFDHLASITRLATFDLRGDPQLFVYDPVKDSTKQMLMRNFPGNQMSKGSVTFSKDSLLILALKSSDTDNKIISTWIVNLDSGICVQKSDANLTSENFAMVKFA